MSHIRTRSTAAVLLLLGAFQGCDCATDDAELVDDDAAAATGATTSGSPSGNGGADSGVTVTGAQGTGGSAACSVGFTSLALSPASSEVVLDATSPADAITFEARGVNAAGDEVPLDEDALSWTVSRDDDTPPGEIADGVLDPFPFAGGLVRVSASGCGATGEATVTFRLDAQVGAPANPDDWEGAPIDGQPGAPEIVYPSDETRLPRNVYRTIFQWYRGATAEARVTFEGPYSTVTVYTDGEHGLCEPAQPEAGCWEVDEAAWQLIAASNAGETVTWTVDALDGRTDPPTILRGDPATMGISKQDVKGAIFYWSTTSAGIRRGRLSETEPIDYVADGTTFDDGTEVGCVACHVVSRSGKYLAAPTSAGDNGLWIYEVTEEAPPTPLVRAVPDTGGHGFATISPDDERVVAAWGGEMWEVERDGGAYVTAIDLGEIEATHPDWSPLGDEVIFATEKGDSPGGASLARVSYDAGVWGAPEVFLAPPEDRTNLFPMFSPGGEWIAFSQGKGGHGDEEAQLFVVPTAEAAPVELVRANRVTSNEITDGQYQNSQPTWAPPGDLHWIAFNSKREYGVILEDGTQQIWVAAVDVDAIGSGDDPSYPAFRVPFQGLDENNHRAFWTLDITEGEGGGGGAGGASGAGGDGGGGGEPGCSEILGVGDPCDPVDNCCETGTICDSYDDGMTYECHTINPN